MSNRDSMGFGDLIPQDVVDIFAHEKHSKRGRKKRSHSLGRALGWLKGKKKKDLGFKGPSLGLGPALDLALDGHPAKHQGGHKGGQKSGRQAHPQAVPKRDDDKTPEPPLLQENVFIEASRPKYLENLHTEALEGLKMMQQEETNNGMEYQDNESTISTMTVHTDGEGGGFMTDSTIADTSSVVSVQSTRSSRSGLTRQESTFRPLNSGKKSEKAKARRRHRKPSAGIPQHVQRELGLDRVDWTLTERFDGKQLYNGETDDSPTTDGPQKAASNKLQDINVIHPLNKDQLEQLGATNAGHRDDLALLHRLGPDLSGEQRPRSLAVPWMTTANSSMQKPPSPVMSMSPQAAYMSKIIPNAVLPPSIEVVEISRGRSRNSVRTVSKSSLLLSSPAPSRASSRASSSRASAITSASHYNPSNPSDSSCWSNSESSETLVSDSSTISSSSTPRHKRSQDADVSAKDKISVHSSISKASKCTSNGKLTFEGDKVKKEGPFVRSLSVIKSKRAPPPPNRSYSLHNKMKRRSRDLADVRVISGESSLHSISATGEENGKNKSGSSPMPSRIRDSPGYNADTSSLDDSTGSVSFSPIRSQLQALNSEEAAKVEETVSKDVSQEKKEPLKENKLRKVVSPSSGYSSQDGAPAQLSKQPNSSSPRHKRGILAKLQRLFPGSTPAVSITPLTQPEAIENTKSTEGLKPDTSVDTASVSPFVLTLRELFNIPPPPKVHAPPPPPPEVWAHNKRTFELLLGPPAPDNIQAIIKKNPKDRRQQRQSPSASTEGSVKSLVVERKLKNPTVTVEMVNGSLQVLETKKVQESVILNAEIDKENNNRLTEQNVDLKDNSKVTERVEKVRVSDILNGMLVKAIEKREERLATVREEEPKKTYTQATEVKTNIHTLPAISLVRIPPPMHHLPQPCTKQTTEVALDASVQVVASPESSWPPPPPTMEQVGLNGPDEIDFPLPPPPMFGAEGLVVPLPVPPERPVPGGDSSCTTTSFITVVKTERVGVTTEEEPQKPSTSQGVAQPLLTIPPPPPYTAPPPPVAVYPPTTKKVSPLPPIEVPPPPPKEVSPPPPIEVPPLPPIEVPAPRPIEVSPPQPIEVSLLPPIEVPPPPPKVVSPPPTIVFSPLPPIEVPAPPPIEVSPPQPIEVSLLPPIEVPPPPPKEVSPLPPQEVSPPPPKEISPPPYKEVSTVRPKEYSLSTPPLVKDISPTLVMVESSPVKEVSLPLVIKVSPLPPKQVSILSTEEVSQPSSEENTTTPVCKLSPPQNIPPPPPLSSQPQSSEQKIDLPQDNIPSKSETNLVTSNTIPFTSFTPPQSIPPPPTIQVLHQPAIQEAPPSPPFKVSIPPSVETTQEPSPANINLVPPLPVQSLDSIEHQSSPAITANQTLELISAPVVHEKPTSIVTPSLLQMVKLRSVNSSPEPPKAQEQPEAEVTMKNQQPGNQVPTSSASAEAPQKPIRKSLIITSPPSTSPPSTSPPAVVTSQPALPKSQSFVVPPASSSTVLSPTKKSLPAMTTSPSMNLQEAIRLRTAARSKDGPASRLSLHSQTSPIDLHKSPTSTASFIFSKSNKMVNETQPATETKTTIQKNLEVSSVAKVVSEVDSVKTGVKVPPPVAKKPKTKGKEIETSEEAEQTAGQEALQESIMDSAEKTNGTAGTVKGGETPST